VNWFRECLLPDRQRGGIMAVSLSSSSSNLARRRVHFFSERSRVFSTRVLLRFSLGCESVWGCSYAY
jgi:hypothetical protein